ncbi:MAG: DUF1257 domain-containing protein [Bradymonadales bacterium]|nr:DUF1257 domain-containing protein [Bradymonadales bacterium]
MSHFTTLETKMMDLTCIKLACEDLGLTLLEAEEEIAVKGYMGQKEKSKLVIRVHSHYDIGLHESEQGYQFVADWWGIEMVTGLTQQQWIEKFVQRYAYNKVVKEVKQHGFTLEEENVKEDGIHLTVRRWA